MKYFFSFFFLKKRTTGFACMGGSDGGTKQDFFETSQAIANKILDTIEIQSDDDIEEVQHQLEKTVEGCVPETVRILFYRIV